jgi:hypothetical protein|mmetsp:Transcript_9124/g.20369  ORF Transcript_9124/g.20369 Transcript_9124/m.20369 type:complete len:242 (+) Transcript_9124:83-808(+)
MTQPSSSAATLPPNANVVPDEIWIKSFSYLNPRDLLHSVGKVSQTFLRLSSSDSIWGEHCANRWRGKLNVGRFFRHHDEDTTNNPSTEENKHIINNNNNGRMMYCSELIRQFGHVENIPALNMGSLMHEPSSWKEAYLMAEIDSRRQTMAREELVHFKWKLVYNGGPSRMGLRQFEANGTYFSPYIGVCEWLLHGNQLMFAGMSLAVERDENTWGWVIGKGQRTVYYSVEVPNESNNFYAP